MAGKVNPFAAGGGDDRDTEERVRKMKREADEAEERDDDRDEPQEESEDEDEFEVGKKPDRDDEDDDDEGERPSRRDRRKQRGEDLVRAERERAEAAERRHQETQRLLAEALQRAMPQQQQRTDPERDRLEQEAKDLMGQQVALVERHRNAQLEAQRNKQPWTAEMDAKYQEEARQLRDRIAQNDIRRFAPRPQGPQLHPQQLQAQIAQQRVMTEHADVVGNPRAAAAFRSAYIDMIQVRNMPDDWGTLEKAMDEARRRVGLAPRGGRPAPSRGQQRKYGGVSRGASGGGGERPQTITMTKESKAMADAQFSHIKDPKKRYQAWVNRAGARAAQRNAKDA